MNAAVKAIFDADSRPFDRALAGMESKVAAAQAKQLAAAKSTMKQLEAGIAAGGTPQNLAIMQGARVKLAEKIANLENDIQNRVVYAGLQQRKALAREAEDEAVTLATQSAARQEAVQAGYFTRLAAMSAKTRAKIRADARVEAATTTLLQGFAPGIQNTKEDLKPMRDELAQALRARRALRDLGDGVDGLHGKMPGLNLVLRETLVIFHEIGRANWARVPGSLSLVVQGLRQMRGELGVFGALFTVTGAIATAAAVEIGAAIYFTWKHYKLLNEEQKTAREMGGQVSVSYDKEQDSLRRAAEAAKEYAHWLEHLNEVRNNTVQGVDQHVDSMRRSAQADQELRDAQKEGELGQIDLAVKRGHMTEEEGKRQKSGVEIKYLEADAKAKQDALDAQAKELKTDAKDAQDIADASKKEADQAEFTAHKSRQAESIQFHLNESKERVRVNDEVVSAIEKENKKKGYSADTETDYETPEGPYHGSLNQAKASADAARKEQDQYQKQQDQLDDAAKEARRRADDAKGASESLNEKAKTAQNEADEYRQNSPALIAQKESNERDKLREDLLNGGEKSKGFSLNQSQKAGTYAATPPDLMEIKRHLARIAQNTDPHPYTGAPTGPNFGGHH